MARKITGPSVTKVASDTDALLQLQAFIAANAPGMIVESIGEEDGRWVASVVDPPRTLKPRKAGPPPFADDGESEEKPEPPSDEESPDGPPSPDGESDGPPKDGDDKKPGKGAELAEILDLVKQVAMAVGVPVPDELGMGADEPPLLDEPGPPKAGPIDGPGPGPKGPGGAPHPLKPGDIPPGVTPPNSPAFASYNGKTFENPFPADIGLKQSFQAEETDNPNRSIVQASEELNRAVVPWGYWAEKVRPVREAATGARKLVAHVTFAGSVEEAAKQACLDPSTL